MRPVSGYKRTGREHDVSLFFVENVVRKRERKRRPDSVSQARTPQNSHPTQRSKRRRQIRSRNTSLVRALPILAALFSAVLFLSWTDGGQTTRVADPLMLQLDRLAEKAGLGLQEIVVRGHRRTSVTDVYAAMKLRGIESFLLFDAEETRKRIEKLPWINQAEIRKSFPWRIEVQVTERAPFALWRHHGTDTIIDRTGRHLETVEFGRVRSLPLVAGDGAEAVAHEVLDAVAKWPDLLLAVSVARRIGGRRWDLILSESRRVQLPAHDFRRALTAFMLGERGKRFFDRQFAEVDLRLTGQIILRERSLAEDRYSLPRPVLSHSPSSRNTSSRS